MRAAKADIDPVPGVGLRNQQGERHLLLLGEVRTHFLVDVVRCVALRHQRQRFGPCQRGTLAAGVERGLAPRAEKMQPVLGLAVLARVGEVMVDAERCSR